MTMVPACRSTAQSTTSRLILCSMSRLRRCKRRHPREPLTLAACLWLNTASRLLVYWFKERSARQEMTTPSSPSLLVLLPSFFLQLFRLGSQVLKVLSLRDLCYLPISLHLVDFDTQILYLAL